MAAAAASPAAAVHIATSSAYDGPCTEKPPSTGSAIPVMNAERGEARKTTAFATSCGPASVGVSVCRVITSSSCGGTFVLIVSVIVMPGTTALQRMPIFPYWVATLRVKPMIAVFDVP